MDEEYIVDNIAEVDLNDLSVEDLRKALYYAQQACERKAVAILFDELEARKNA